MLNFYKSNLGKIEELDEFENNCWVSAISPTVVEVDYLINDLGLDGGFVRSALDEEETSRIEIEDNQTLIIVDVPVAQKESENTILYSTMPMGIIMIEKCIVTISLKENPVIGEMTDGFVKNVQVQLKTRFLLLLLLRIASRFLMYLKQIDKISNYMERQLHKSMKNKELIQLLGLEKSLVYFSTSLKANESTLEKILRGRAIKLYEEDQDLLEDVLIEVKQAIEMSNIYSSILSGTMDAFASIISNNLNIVMKVLTSLTIVMAIPTIIFSYYGMNIGSGKMPLDNLWWFPVALSASIMLIVGFILVKKKMF